MFEKNIAMKKILLSLLLFISIITSYAQDYMPFIASTGDPCDKNVRKSYDKIENKIYISNPAGTKFAHNGDIDLEVVMVLLDDGSTYDCISVNFYIPGRKMCPSDKEN